MSPWPIITNKFQPLSSVCPYVIKWSMIIFVVDFKMPLIRAHFLKTKNTFLYYPPTRYVPLILLLVVPYWNLKIFRFDIRNWGYFALVQQSVQVQFSIRVSAWVATTRTWWGCGETTTTAWLKIIIKLESEPNIKQTRLKFNPPKKKHHQTTLNFDKDMRNPIRYSPLLFNSTSSIL